MMTNLNVVTQEQAIPVLRRGRREAEGGRGHVDHDHLSSLSLVIIITIIVITSTMSGGALGTSSRVWTCIELEG